MALQKSWSNDKLSRKVMSFSYDLEQETFIEVSCTNKVHIGQKGFCNSHLLKVYRSLIFRQSKKTSGIFWSARVFLCF